MLPEGFGAWVIDVIPILAFYGLLVGRAQNRNPSLSVPPSLTLVIILAAYFGVIYPHAISPRLALRNVALTPAENSDDESVVTV